MAQTINVDISTRGAPPVAYTHQGDTDRTFLVNLFENGEAFGVAGFTVKVAAILPGDSGYTVITGADMVSATKTTTGTNQLMFTPSAKYTARSGRGIITLIMTTNTGTPATIRPINIDFRIQKSADGPDVIEGASDFPEGLEEIAEQVFQEYLSTYLPPVAPSASAAANKAADAKLTGEALDDLKSDLSGGERTVTHTLAGTEGTYIYPIDLSEGLEYTYTNNSNFSHTLRLYKNGASVKVLSALVPVGGSVTFIPDVDSDGIGGYYNGKNISFTLSTDGVLGLISETENEMQNKIDFVGGKEVEITGNIAGSEGTFIYPISLFEGIKYTYTNTSGAAQTLRLYNGQESVQLVNGGLANGRSITFTAEQDADGIGGYYNTSTVSGKLKEETASLYSYKDFSERILKNKNGIIYTTASARHSFSLRSSSSSDGSIVFHIGGYLNVRVMLEDSFTSGTLQWSDISSDISDYITIDGSQADIVIPSYSNTLVYNTTDGLLHIRNVVSESALYADDIILVANSFANPVDGVLYDEYIRRIVLDNSDGIDSEDMRSRTFNASYHTGATDFATKCQSFSSLLLGDSKNNIEAPTDFETFLFFTDPHLLEGENWQDKCAEFISQIQKYYNSTPTTFCMCGGDWLGNSDLPDEACFKMGYINGFMESMFDNSYLIVGNHDTNYQGKKDSSSETYTTRLSNQSIVDLWYRKGKKSYYKFNGANTTFYCFDTGTETQELSYDNNYHMTQAEWFAESLLTDNSDHIALSMHIIYWQYDEEDLTQGIQPLTLLLSQISSAYNSRGSITVNGTVYNYASSTGKVEFIIGGHYHQDKNGVMNGIPWFMTTNVRHDETLGASFDLVFANYDDGEVKLIRVGSGNNRTISLT